MWWTLHHLIVTKQPWYLNVLLFFHLTLTSLCPLSLYNWLALLLPNTPLARSQVFLPATLLASVVLADSCFYFPPSSFSSWKVSPKRTVGFSLLLLVAHTILPAKTVMSLTLRLKGKWSACVWVCVCGWGLVFNSQTYRRANIQSSSSLHIVRPHTVTRSCSARCI